MMNRWGRTLFVVATALFLVSPILAAVQAGRHAGRVVRLPSQDRRAQVPAGPRAEASAVLNDDGSISVETVLSLADGFPGAFAVDVAGFDALNGVSVDALGSAPASVPFIVERDRGAAVIRWSRTPGDSALRYRVRHTLGGAVTPGRTSDVLTWGILSSNQEFGLKEVSSLLACPEGPISLSGAARSTKLGSYRDGRYAISAEEVPARSALKVTVGLAKGAVRPGFGWVKFMKNTGGTIAMFLLPAVCLLGLMAVFLTRGMDPAGDVLEAGPSGV
ncbi:MAG: hypothetical protein WC943_05290, partial [Elusimicrobiota bacterium]